MSDIAISVENLSKAYRIGLADEACDTLTSAVLSWAKAPLRNFNRLRKLNTFGSPDSHEGAQDILWALKNVNFQVMSGDVVGIIGRNGAGKSTLLKVLSRITDPTSGRAVIRGRVSSLLEVGTGFHPELTGRENIYMNGTILGMSKREIDRKFEQIVDFSGVEKFIDTPVKRYSSGMKVRLAFSVAAHLEPEILIIDEVLAVGDFDFQRKCIGKMNDVATSGRTVLFVSHNMAAVENLCTRAVLMEHGSVRHVGTVSEVIGMYHDAACDSDASSDLANHPGRIGKEAPVLQSIRLVGRDGAPTSSILCGGDATFEIVLDPSDSRLVRNAILVLHVTSVMGERICAFHSRIQRQLMLNFDRRCVVRCEFQNCRLAPGEYRVRLDLRSFQKSVEQVEDALSFMVESSDVYLTGQIPPPRFGLYLPEVSWDAPSEFHQHVTSLGSDD